MDPIMRIWMFHNWIEDYNDEFELLKNQGYLIGSFINPEAVKKILGVGANTFVSSEEEFEAAANKILEDNKKLDLEEASKPKRRRKRRVIDG